MRRVEFDREERDNIWKDIWTAKVAPKIKFFMWKVINNFLPIRKILQDKGIQCDLSCAVCGERGENQYSMCSSIAQLVKTYRSQSI